MRINGSATKQGRLAGLDVARGLALFGMVVVNFKLAMGAEHAGSSWLQSLVAVLDGRAVATFVVLAGVGASLGSARVWASSDYGERRPARVKLVKRAAFLFVAGWLFYPIWPADILHFYGVYLAVGAAVLFSSSRVLLTLAGGVVAVSVVFLLVGDPLANWDLATYEYRNLLTPTGFLRNLFLDGFHPVFPWLSFYLVGMVLGRTPLHDAAWRRKLFVTSVVVVGMAEALSWWALGPKGLEPDVAESSWRWFLAVTPLPPFPLYLVAGVGTAVMVMCASMWLADRLPQTVVAMVGATGQMVLTMYVAHVVIGLGVLEEMGRLENQSLAWAVWSATVFNVCALVAAWLWRKRFRRGPLEALMRKISG